MCYRNLLLGAVLGVGVVAFASKAQATSFADIQYWIGSGNNRAGLEIDWNDGKANHALSWGYRWNGGATGEQMFDAIVATDPRLYAEISGPTQFGTTVFGLGYDHNGDQVFPLSPTLGFSPQHLAVTNFAGVNDNRSAVDAGDRWQEGWLSAGYWNYWVSTDTRVSADVTDWSFSDDGMTTRALANGDWDGRSFSVGFVDSTPANATAASPVPEPTALAGLSIAAAVFGLRRRRRIPALLPLLAGAMAIAGERSADAAYIYDPNDFATEVVTSTGFPANPSASDYYSHPDAILGRPALKFQDVFGSDPSAFHRVKLIEAPYATGLSGEPLVTTFAAGQSVTVKMGRTVNNDPKNPFGIDLIVYGNSFFSATGGGFGGDSTNLNTTTVGGLFAENVRVSVSPDNVNWYSYPTDAAHTGDGYYPTNSYLWNRAGAAWTDTEADPTKPVDPSIGTAALSGKTAADVLDLYNGAAGGAGFDLAESGFSSINYVRFDGLSGFSGGEIDAVAAVTPVPEPAALGAAAIGLLALVRRPRRLPV